MSDGQPVGLAPVIDVVGSDQLPRAWHVLNYGIGISRQVLPHMACKHATVGVKSSAGSGADDQHDRFPLIELLSGRRDGGDKNESQSDYKPKQARNYDRHKTP
jgi:hypothetical protein